MNPVLHTASVQYHAPDLDGRTVRLHASLDGETLTVRRLDPPRWREAWPVMIARGLAREWPKGACATALRALGAVGGAA